MVTSVVLPLALAVIMFTLGLGLTIADFRRVFVYPRGISIGMVNLLLVSPLLAFVMAELFNLDPLLALGLVLLGASPGGTLSNVFTHIAKGETAMSVTMTAISSVTALVAIPFYLGLANEYFEAGNSLDGVNMWGVVLRTFLITILPLSLGMWARSRAPERMEELRPALSRASLVLFVLVVIGAALKRAAAEGWCHRIRSYSESWICDRRRSAGSDDEVSITPPSRATICPPSILITPKPRLAVPGSMPITTLIRPTFWARRRMPPGRKRGRGRLSRRSAPGPRPGCRNWRGLR